MQAERDHGGNLDEAMARHGGSRADWIDLSTGINPVPWPVPPIDPRDWTALPDRVAQDRLVSAARVFWEVPDGADVLAAPGASALIAAMPRLAPPGRVWIDAPTYNEHEAAFVAEGWNRVCDGDAEARVLVHPNNPDGRVYTAADADTRFCVIDESFCDVMPDRSLVSLGDRDGVVVLKSFGKFWGLAGLRLGFAIARPETITRLRTMLGPWAVSGPALGIGAAALSDPGWAQATRARLAEDAQRLDRALSAAGAQLQGGTDLFRLARVHDASVWQGRLARSRIWTRVFPRDPGLIRLGLPAPGDWARVEAAL